jgi:hypothetical protein
VVDVEVVGVVEVGAAVDAVVLVAPAGVDVDAGGAVVSVVVGSGDPSHAATV